MGQCYTEPQKQVPICEIESNQHLQEEKPVQVNAELQQQTDPVPIVDEEKIKEEKAIAIQSAYRSVKAKKEANIQKDLAEKDKPQDAVLYHGEFVIPALPQFFKDKVDKSVTNENRMFPAYKLENGAVYQGQWKLGQQSGYGMMKKIDGTFLEGQWKLGQLIDGAVLYSNQDIYAGSNTNGIFKFVTGVTYVGDVQNRIPHGKGEETHSDGSKYEGGFERGLKHGVGKLVLHDGSVYDGEFFKGEIQGNGIFKWGNGTSYTGQWYKSAMHGHGKFEWADHKIYVGDFKNDMKDGHGKITYTDGSSYEGQFQDNKRHGRGKIVKADKSMVECEWKNGDLVE